MKIIQAYYDNTDDTRLRCYTNNIDKLNKWKIRAYAILVRAEKYILDEADREFEHQKLVLAEYAIAVADYLIK